MFNDSDCVTVLVTVFDSRNLSVAGVFQGLDTKKSGRVNMNIMQVNMNL